MNFQIGDTVSWVGPLGVVYKAIVVPTGKNVPEGEVNVMLGNGSVVTMQASGLTLHERFRP